MKTLFPKLLVISLIFVSSFATAQSAKFGIKGGLNLANIGGDSEGTSLKPGLNIGGYVAFTTTDHLIIQPELIYSMQGANIKSGNDKGKAKYNYINVPVIFKIFPSEGFNFQVGPQVGILTSGKISSGDVDIDFKDVLNTFDFSLAFGVGYDFERVNLSARYNLGITDTVEDNGDDNYPNRVIQLSLGISF